MKRVGFIGWRGMVGSVLLERMNKENDFQKMNSYFFSTSQVGQQAPRIPNSHDVLLSAMDTQELSRMDVLVSCQGGEYTSEIFPMLQKNNWKGVWIDAASTLRMNDDALIVLDPLNRKDIHDYLFKNGRILVSGNCTVSLLLIALHGLFKEDLIEWVSSMTYQAASGAGAKNMNELLSQMKTIGDEYGKNLAKDALTLEKEMRELMSSEKFPKKHFGHPLALNVLPWIDSEMPNGQSREEWKAQVEANKILKSKKMIPIDGTCVRVGALRCHSQALTIKLKKSVHESTVEELLETANPWVKIIKNNKTDTLNELVPEKISGSLTVPIGRIRKMNLGETFYNGFTVGDQLLWGAAEPLRCALIQVLEH